MKLDIIWEGTSTIVDISRRSIAYCMCYCAECGAGRSMRQCPEEVMVPEKKCTCSKYVNTTIGRKIMQIYSISPDVITTKTKRAFDVCATRSVLVSVNLCVRSCGHDARSGDWEHWIRKSWKVKQNKSFKVLAVVSRFSSVSRLVPWNNSLFSQPPSVHG